MVWSASCYLIFLGIYHLLYWHSRMGRNRTRSPFQRCLATLYQHSHRISLTFTGVFLQHFQQQQECRHDLCLNYALKIDTEVYDRLRELTEDIRPNPIFETPAVAPNRIE